MQSASTLTVRASVQPWVDHGAPACSGVQAALDRCGTACSAAAVRAPHPTLPFPPPPTSAFALTRHRRFERPAGPAGRVHGRGRERGGHHELGGTLTGADLRRWDADGLLAGRCWRWQDRGPLSKPPRWVPLPWAPDLNASLPLPPVASLPVPLPPTPQAMDGTMSLEEALEKRLNVINCTPADIQAFLKAHPAESRLTPVRCRCARAGPVGRGGVTAAKRALGCAPWDSSARSASLPGLPRLDLPRRPSLAGRAGADPPAAGPRRRCVPDQARSEGFFSGSASTACACAGVDKRQLPARPPAGLLARLALLPRVCSGGFRELCLPICRELGVPPKNLFANRM